MPPTTDPRRRVKFKQRTPRSTRGNGRRTQRALVAALLAIGFGAPATLLLRAVVREGLADPARIARRFQVGAPVNDEPLLRLPAAPAAPVATTTATAVRGSAPAGWSTPAPDAPVSRSWEAPFANGGRTTVINPSAPVALAPTVRAAAPNAGLAAGFAPSFAAAPAARGVAAPAPVGLHGLAAPALSSLVAAAPAAANLVAVESAPAARPGLTTGAASLSPGPRSHAVLPVTNVTLGSFTWSGAAAASGSPPSPNWNVGNNWVGNAAPGTNASADIVYTPTPTGATATNVEQVYQINSLTFQGPVAGLGPDTPSYNVTQSSFAYLGVGAGGILDASANPQTLSTEIYASVADNTINVSNAAGRLNMPGAVANPSASPAVPIALYLQGANRVVTVDGPGTTNITGVITQGGVATSGALVKNGVGTLILTGDNSYTGGTTLNAGVLDIRSNTALGTGTFTVNGGAVANGSFFGTSALANAVTVNADFAHGTSSSFLSFDGPVALGAANRTITSTDVNQYGLTFNGAISASGPGVGLTFVGSASTYGYFAFAGTGANTYSGATIVDNAELDLYKDGGATALPGNLTIQNGGNVYTSGGQLAATTTVTTNTGGSFNAIGNFSFPNNESIATLNGDATGFVTFGNQFTATTLTVGQGTTASLLQDGFLNSDRPARRAGAVTAAVFPFGDTGGQLNKVSSGTLTLTNNNTYSGGTLVTAGALFANNSGGGEGGSSASATGSGDVLVLDGARLGGNGSIGRPTFFGEGTTPGSNTTIGGTLATSSGLTLAAVANPAILGAGATFNSTALLRINGDLTLTSTAVLEAELGGTVAGDGYDQVYVLGVISLGGDLSLSTLNGFVPTVGDTFYILDATGSGSVIGGVFANVTPDPSDATKGSFTAANGYLFRVNYTDSDPLDDDGLQNDVSVTFLAVPEPGSLALATVGVFAGLGAWVRRRRAA